jgi:hypothetical protein
VSPETGRRAGGRALESSAGHKAQCSKICQRLTPNLPPSPARLLTKDSISKLGLGVNLGAVQVEEAIENERGQCQRPAGCRGGGKAGGGGICGCRGVGGGVLRQRRAGQQQAAEGQEGGGRLWRRRRCCCRRLLPPWLSRAAATRSGRGMFQQRVGEMSSGSNTDSMSTSRAAGAGRRKVTGASADTSRSHPAPNPASVAVPAHLIAADCLRAASAALRTGRGATRSAEDMAAHCMSVGRGWGALGRVEMAAIDRGQHRLGLCRSFTQDFMIELAQYTQQYSSSPGLHSGALALCSAANR